MSTAPTSNTPSTAGTGVTTPNLVPIGRSIAGPVAVPKVAISLSFVHTAPTTFVLSNVVEVVHGSFDHKAVWDDFLHENPCSSEDELIKALVEVSRSNFSPNSKNWPGATVTITNGTTTKTVVLQPGVTSLKPYNKNVKGNNYTWTRICIASATLFQQIWRSDSTGISIANSIAGNNQGNTQFMTLTRDWTQNHQDLCAASFDKFVTDNSLKAIDPVRKTLIKIAATRMINKVLNNTIELSWTFNMLLMYSATGTLFDEVRPPNNAFPTA
jgi:hypothetical protein